MDNVVCHISDLRLQDVSLVDKYCKRITLLQKMTENKCHGCIKLAEHMKSAEEIMKHKEKVDELKFKMSDEALQQMPEFQGRVHCKLLHAYVLELSFHQLDIW